MSCFSGSHAYQMFGVTGTTVCLPKNCDQPIKSFYLLKKCNYEAFPDPPNPCITTDLRPVTFQFNQPTPTIAQFYIGNYSSVSVSWEVLTTVDPLTITTVDPVFPVINGIFSITIPAGTTDFKLTVHLTTIDLVLVLPETSPFISLNSSDLLLYMMLKYANKIAIDTSGIDHTTSPPVPPAQPTPVGFGEQLGPHRASRALAIVHIAIMDALIAIKGGYTPLIYNPGNISGSAAAAIAQATHDTLAALFPLQYGAYTRINDALAYMLSSIPDSPSLISAGVAVGAASAAAVLLARSGDHSVEGVIGTNYFPSGAFGVWEAIPNTSHTALGATWGVDIPTFVLPANNTIPCPSFPVLTSLQYAAAYNQAKSIGGDGIITTTARSSWETDTGLFWAYDGTPSLCAPPRLYNQLVFKVLSEHLTTFMALARNLTIVNVAMADTAIACWYYKYFYKLWRPTSAIHRANNTIAGPTYNADTNPDINWKEYGAPKSNTSDHFVPPFPTYPSGHATFGGTIFEILRQVVGDVPFTFTSDEFNGTTVGDGNVVRPLAPRTYSSLTQAEDENGFSRLPLGIHFVFDKTAGITLGNGVGNYVHTHAYL